MNKAVKRLTLPLEFPPKTIGRDELNLAEFPIASLSHRVPDDCKQLVFEDEIRDQSSGEVIPRKLTVTAHATLGLPNSLDDDVIVILMHLTKERNDFTSRTVPFSRMEVIELLGWPRNGQSFDRLEESLSRWHGVSLRYDNAWWDKAAQAWRTEEFHILDNVSSFGHKLPRRVAQHPDQSSLPLFTFTWNEVVFRSFQAGNLKSINLSLYLELSLAQSRRAYRFLDKRFYRENELRFDLKSFACGKIGFSQSYSAAKIKEKLQPALDELEQVGFLQPMSREKRYEKVSHGTWRIVFVRGAETKEQEAALNIPTSTEAPAEPLPSPFIGELVKRGVTESTAIELVQQHQDEPEIIETRLEVFDWLTDRADKRLAKSPAGYLVSSITRRYAVPKGFESKADRQKREEATQIKERKAAEARTRQQEAARLEHFLAEQAKAYRRSRTPEQLAQLEADAITQASEETRRNLDDPALKPFRKTLLSSLVRDHIARLLQAESSEPA
jgi:hypothetical protein